MATNKDDFLARLERLEASKSVQKSRQQTITRNKGSGLGKRLGMVALGVLLIGGIAGGGYTQRERLRPYWEQLKGKAEEAQELVPMASQEAQKGAIKRRAGETRLASMYGGMVYSPAVMSRDGVGHIVDDIVANFQMPSLLDEPAEFRSFDPQKECTFRKPKRREKLHSVSVDYGLIETSVSAFSTKQVAAKVEAYFNWNQKYTKQHPLEDYLVSNETKVVDVFVTDKSAPVYLVLQSAGAAVIWNVLASEGVKIAHVAIISRSHSGLILPDQSTSFEAINGTDFDKETRSRTRIEEGTACSIHIFRKPKEHWIQWVKANKQDGVYRNQRDSYFRGHRLYDRWFTRVFGASSEDTLYGAESAAHVLVGPVPAQKIPYQGVAGRIVHMTRADYFFSGPPEKRRAEILAMEQSIVDKATNGGFDQVKPELMELTE